MKYDKNGIIEISKLIIKAFAILLFWGYILPRLVDFTLTHIIDFSRYENNSKFVNSHFQHSKGVWFYFKLILKNIL